MVNKKASRTDLLSQIELFCKDDMGKLIQTEKIYIYIYKNDVQKIVF